MNEHSLYGPIVIGANREGMKLYRIHDGGGANPFDIGGICGCGRGVGIEVKISKLSPAPDKWIEWAKFQNQQRTWLKEYAENNALAIVIVYYEASFMVNAIRLEHQSNFITGWRPRSNQVVQLSKGDGVYNNIRKLCVTCNPYPVDTPT